MKIAMVAACPFPSPQGSQVFVRQMCERLAERGHEVHLLTYGGGAGTSRGAEDYVHHRLRRLPGDARLRSGPAVAKVLLDLFLLRALVRIVREQDLDLIHAHNYEAAVVGIAARRITARPLLYHSHNLMVDELGTYFQRPVTRRLGAWFGGLLDRAIPRAADHAIALCDYSATVMRRSGVREENLTVLGPAVEEQQAPGDKRAARDHLGLDSETPLVGYCGNLDGYQNLGLMFDALRVLSRLGRRRPAELLICSHEDTTRVRGVATALGYDGALHAVHAEGYLASSFAMQAADVLVLPRRHGSGLPIKLLNYMSQGRPVVTAGCGGKVIRHEVDGLVVADDDAEDMAAAIVRLIDDRTLAARLGRRARERFRETMTWSSVLPVLENIYAGLKTGHTA
ncbi:MAG: glycosyltransferase family 4 protein [Candidatus Binatia bacterium]